jgi:hypothetical protein
MHALLISMPYSPFRTALICVPYSIDVRPSPFCDYLSVFLQAASVSTSLAANLTIYLPSLVSGLPSPTNLLVDNKLL